MYFSGPNTPYLNPFILSKLKPTPSANCSHSPLSFPIHICTTSKSICSSALTLRPPSLILSIKTRPSATETPTDIPLHQTRHFKHITIKNTTTKYSSHPIMALPSDHDDFFTPRCIWVNGPVIVGAGPSGLAVAACLKEQSVPFVILEKADCIASLWQRRTYDRLKLHLPKQFCQLPKLPFPEDYPEYPSKKQFIDYLESYAQHFDIKPRFNECVQSAKYDETCGLWCLKSCSIKGVERVVNSEVEYISQWLVVATGENAESVVPEIEGLNEFGGRVIHACDYKSGEDFKGKRVLVVGCGNSGMEVSLDLCNHNAFPSMVVRSSVHVLPREVFGKSTFRIATFLMKWLPLWLVDKLLLILTWLVLGNTQRFGLRRPSMGPLHFKNTNGKTPVLDIGALQKIKTGGIQVVPGIKRFSHGRVELVDGNHLYLDSVILATGYRSNVPSWLQESDLFSKNGLPNQPFPNGWKGKSGLYAAGFTRKGLSGASLDATRIADDIGQVWKEETKLKKRFIACNGRFISQF